MCWQPAPVYAGPLGLSSPCPGCTRGEGLIIPHTPSLLWYSVDSSGSAVGILKAYNPATLKAYSPRLGAQAYVPSLQLEELPLWQQLPGLPSLLVPSCPEVCGGVGLRRTWDATLAVASFRSCTAIQADTTLTLCPAGAATCTDPVPGPSSHPHPASRRAQAH